MNFILNVIFPAFLGPAVAVLFMPFLAVLILLIEGCVYYINARLNAQDFQYYWIVVLIIANLASTSVGIALSAVLPSGLNQDLKNGPESSASIYWWLSWPIWWLLSIIIEYLIFWLMTRRNLIIKLGRAVFVANTASYVFLLAAFLALH